MALPKTLDEWQRSAQNFSIDTGSISNTTFPSGSKFSREDYYALRVLYPRVARLKSLRKDHECLPPDSVERVMGMIEANQRLRSGFALLDRRIETLTHEDLLSAGCLGPGLAELQVIVDRGAINPGPNDSAEEGVSLHKILKSPRAQQSPRVTRSMTAGLSLPFRPHISGVPSTPTPAQKKPASAQMTTPDVKDYHLEENMPSPLEHSLASSTLASAPPTGSSVASIPNDDSIYVDDLERGMFIAGDEQTVNASLVNLLQPITWACGLSRGVYFDRQPFYLGPKANPLYQARVDGLLMIKDDIKGFMEVKPTLRNVDGVMVRIQESAEMAAFIYDQGPKMTSPIGKKWMISMGGWEGYITIARYNQAYVDFLYGAEIVQEAQSFMKMQEYGPFNLTRKNQLKMFLCNVIVLMGNDAL